MKTHCHSHMQPASSERIEGLVSSQQDEPMKRSSSTCSGCLLVRGESLPFAVLSGAAIPCAGRLKAQIRQGDKERFVERAVIDVQGEPGPHILHHHGHGHHHHGGHHHKGHHGHHHKHQAGSSSDQPPPSHEESGSPESKRRKESPPRYLTEPVDYDDSAWRHLEKGSPGPH